MEETEVDSDPAVAEAAQALAEQVLRKISGVKAVYRYPKSGIFNHNDLNDNRYVVKVVDAEGRTRTITTACSSELPHWLSAAIEAKKKIAEIIGKDAIEAAEEQVRLGAPTAPQSTEPPEMTEAEVQWLAEWHDAQPEPQNITFEQANAALAAHRATSGGTSATQVLFEAQVRQITFECWHALARSRAPVGRFSSGFCMCLCACVALSEAHAKIRPRYAHVRPNTRPLHSGFMPSYELLLQSHGGRPRGPHLYALAREAW